MRQPTLTASLILAAVSWSVAAEAPPFVAGYERLRRAGQGSGAEAGEVLLSELSCLACHGERPALAPLAWKPGPDLSAVGDRVRPAYLRAFLADPAQTKPGTTMPGVLSSAAPGVVEDLVQYLSTLRGKPEPVAAANGTAKEGEELFRSVGCLACHSEVPLGPLGEKYAHGALERFLRHPLAVRPAARMPDLHLSEQEAASLAAYLAPVEPEDGKPFAPDAASAQRGKQFYQQYACAACHEHSAERPVRPVRAVLEGCLADAISAAPHYALDAEQRTALHAALGARGSAAPEPRAAIRQFMLQRNCFACHQREGFGGPAPEIAEHFTSTRDDLGETGRLPPPLDGAGRKFQPAALEAILRGNDPVRKYMRVRMGDFGEDLSHALPPLLAAADLDPNEKPTIGQLDPSKVGRNEAGRQIVGTTGYACIACHDLHGHASLGIGAYDLAEMPKRLRPEWMRDFLLNPAAFPTGVRMPAFWPGGKPMNPKLGGDAPRQIDAVRVYLTEADQSVPPPGFADAAAYELKPAARPIVFRTFMAGVGTHAIAVGFPAGVNVAFDALEARWALAWRGRFLDAEGTWNMRVARMEKPLGEDLIKLEGAGALSIAGQPKAALRFHGYRLEPDGVPVFLYTLGALAIEDRVEPTDSHGLRRQLRVSGQTTESVSFAAHPPTGVIVKPASGTVLDFKNGVAELTEELSW